MRFRRCYTMGSFDNLEWIVGYLPPYLLCHSFYFLLSFVAGLAPLCFVSRFHPTASGFFIFGEVGELCLGQGISQRWQFSSVLLKCMYLLVASHGIVSWCNYLLVFLINPSLRQSFFRFDLGKIFIRMKNLLYPMPKYSIWLPKHEVKYELPVTTVAAAVRTTI